MYRSVFAMFACLGLISQANAGVVNLNTWTQESYPSVPGFNDGTWTVDPTGSSVLQSVNGQPTFFYSDFNAIDSRVTGTIEVQTQDDDDFIGFALGFQPNDSTNLAADYLLIDWKQATQTFNFDGNPATPGSTALLGLAVSRVTGIPTADEFWGHTNFVQNPAGGLEELARGNTLGSTGWEDNTPYDFKFIFETDRLQVFVDNVLEIDVDGSIANGGPFSDGRLAFYNFSQSIVKYDAFEVDPAGVVPEPTSFAIFGLGVLGLVGGRRRVRGKA